MKIYHRIITAFSVLSFFSLVIVFSGCDSTDNPVNAGNTKLSTVSGLRVVLGQSSNYYAIVSWTASPDKDRSDFSGYRITTYKVDSLGHQGAVFDSSNASASATTFNVTPLQPAQRYISYVTALSSTSGYTSDSAATIIYGAVFVNTDSIDEYKATGPAMSGYGWNGVYGIGTRYSFSTGNLANIDLHIRDQGGLTFFSPKTFLTGGNTTLMGLVGGGQTAFDQTSFTEPTASSIPIVADNVYVIKTQSNYYIKIWVLRTGNNTNGYQYVAFKYKVQSVPGLPVL